MITGYRVTFGIERKMAFPYPHVLPKGDQGKSRNYPGVTIKVGTIVRAI